MFLLPPCHGVSHQENSQKKKFEPQETARGMGTSCLKRAEKTNAEEGGKGKKVRTTSDNADGKFVSEKSMSAGAKCVSENSTTVGNVVRHRAVSTRSRCQEE